MDEEQVIDAEVVEHSVDPQNSEDHIEDLAFQHRVKALTAQRKWHELRAVLMVYGSALAERETRT